MIQLTRRVAASTADAQQLEIWLRPCMRSRHYKTGQTLFSSGDPADRLYCLVSGAVELPGWRQFGRSHAAGWPLDA